MTSIFFLEDTSRSHWLKRNLYLNDVYFHCRQSSLAATGTLTGKLSIWDVPTQTNRNTCQHTVSFRKNSLANPQQKRQILFLHVKQFEKKKIDDFCYPHIAVGKLGVWFGWWSLNVYGLIWTFAMKAFSYTFTLLKGGVVKLKWDTTSPLVYTACLDGVVRMWDARNGKCCSEWSGHQDALLDFDISR